MKFSTILVVAGAAVTTVVGRVVFNPPAPFNTSAFTTYNKFNAGLPSGHRILQITTDPADDQQWQAAVCKGEQLLQGIKGTDAEAGQLFNPPMSSAQSEFRQFPQEFNRWNYILTTGEEVSVDYGRFEGFWGIKSAMEALGLNMKLFREGGLNGLQYMCHGDLWAAEDEEFPVPYDLQPYTVDGREYYSTGGFFAFGMNFDQGVIMAMNRRAPEHAVGPLFPKDGLPKLRRSSDIAWGLWKMGAEPRGKIKNIRFFFSLNISNDLTTRLLLRAIKGESYTFPGNIFSMESEEGKALLASPNGVMVAFFLMQHKEELGPKMVRSVLVFTSEPVEDSDDEDEPEGYHCMIFEVVDAPA